MFFSGFLWVINVILIFFITFSTGYFSIFFRGNETTSSSVIRPSDMRQQKDEVFVPKPKGDQDFSSIVTKDIFNTTTTFSTAEEQFNFFSPSEVVSVLPIPMPPDEIPLVPSSEEEFNFLPTLQVAVHGTVISNNPHQNIAFLENVRTKEEKGYMVGDIVEDAQIMFIGKDRVVFIRSNGQQETIYINASLTDEGLLKNSKWEGVIEKVDAKTMRINVPLFVKKVVTVGVLLDELDLISYVVGGIPRGCQIGSDGGRGSLTEVLGLKKNDIILSVADISPALVEKRIALYEKILTASYEAGSEQDIIVELMRGKEKITMKYILFVPKKEEARKERGAFSLGKSAPLPHDPLIGKNERREQKK